MTQPEPNPQTAPPHTHRAAAVIGGTHGLGHQLALRARTAGLTTVVYGRSADTVPTATGFDTRRLDLTDLDSVRTADIAMPTPAYLFWVAGAFLKKSLVDTEEAELTGLTQLLFTGPVLFLRRLLAAQDGPVHLVTIASSSSWKRREREALYCGLKAAQATLTRNLVPELTAAHPGSRVTLINPGGLAVPDFHTGLEIDYGHMMDPGEVAGIIWDLVRRQTAPFQEAQILRSGVPGREGVPEVSFGARVPQPPQAEPIAPLP
ncbi:SDR family oxidoreductase [Streptomyces sp. RGM 3693]|uniref:SDR family oxidoreductase n=1 Tax=Streptomyces sp. RGM 3693 TaxID=3413284 RepID=UPI003D298D4D